MSRHTHTRGGQFLANQRGAHLSAEQLAQERAALGLPASTSPDPSSGALADLPSSASRGPEDPKIRPVPASKDCT
jgi:hypothetical protein